MVELVQWKHKLIKWEGERERARTLQRLESSRAIGQQDVDEAMSESSWTALAKGRKETGGALSRRVKWRSWKS